MSRSRLSRSRLSLVLLSALALLAAACGSDAADDDAAPAAEVGSGELSGEITVWTWDGAPGTDNMNALAAAFEEATGVTVVLGTPDRDNYVAQSQLALNSGEVIDVLGVQPSASAIELSASLRPVSEYADSLENGLDGYAASTLAQLEKVYEGDTIYSVPFGSTGSAVCFYNNDILTEVGVGVPETWADVAALTAALEAQKPDVLTLVGPADTWFQDELVLTMAGQYAPEFFDSVRYDDAAWNQPGYVEALGRYGELFEDGTLQRSALDLGYVDAMSTFNSGNAAIVCNGSWEAGLLVKSFREENGIAIDEVGVMPLPADDAASRSLRSFLDITWGIPTTSANPEAAAAFISFATQGEGIDIWAPSLGFIPSANDWSLPDSALEGDALAAEGYATLQGLIASPSSDRNNLSAFSGQVGSYVLEVAQGRMSAQDAADQAEEDLRSGLYS